MNILLFDENIEETSYISHCLSKHHHEVNAAGSLSLVHKQLRFTDPDYVCVDTITFPYMDAVDLEFLDSFERKFKLFTYDNIQELVDEYQQKDNTHQYALMVSNIALHRRLMAPDFNPDSAENRTLLKKYGLRPPLARLLSYFVQHRNTEIAFQELISLLWEDGSDSHQQTLYAYIHQLREFLEEREAPISLRKGTKGTYSLHAPTLG